MLHRWNQKSLCWILLFVALTLTPKALWAEEIRWWEGSGKIMIRDYVAVSGVSKLQFQSMYDLRSRAESDGMLKMASRIKYRFQNLAEKWFASVEDLMKRGALFSFRINDDFTRGKIYETVQKAFPLDYWYHKKAKIMYCLMVVHYKKLLENFQKTILYSFYYKKVKDWKALAKEVPVRLKNFLLQESKVYNQGLMVALQIKGKQKKLVPFQEKKPLGVSEKNADPALSSGDREALIQNLSDLQKRLKNYKKVLSALLQEKDPSPESIKGVIIALQQDIARLEWALLKARESAKKKGNPH